jgi:hypothetical protein
VQVQCAIDILAHAADLSETTVAALRAAVASGVHAKEVSSKRTAYLEGLSSAAVPSAALSAVANRLMIINQQASLLAPSPFVPFMSSGGANPTMPQAFAQAHACGSQAHACGSPPHGAESQKQAVTFQEFVATRLVKEPSSKRQQLTVAEAVQIYELRPSKTRGTNLYRDCRTLAPFFGVTPKTIRDVWSGRTWVEATRHLWTEHEVLARCSQDGHLRRERKRKLAARDEIDAEHSSSDEDESPKVSSAASPHPSPEAHNHQGNWSLSSDKVASSCSKAAHCPSRSLSNASTSAASPPPDRARPISACAILAEAANKKACLTNILVDSDRLGGHKRRGSFSAATFASMNSLVSIRT